MYNFLIIKLILNYVNVSLFIKPAISFELKMIWINYNTSKIWKTRMSPNKHH